MDTSQWIRDQIDNILDFDNQIITDLEEADLSDQLNEEIYENTGQFDINQLLPEVAIFQLHFTEYQYYQLQSYISRYGDLVSLYELAAIEGISYDDMIRWMPFFTLHRATNKLNAKQIFAKGRSTLLLRYAQTLEHRAGYDRDNPNGYLGPPMQLVFKYQYKTAHFSAALAGEKDAGEQLFKGAQKWGFDHYSFHVALKEIGLLKSLIVGDFRLGFGQRLILGSALLGGSGVSMIRKFVSPPQPVASMNESRFLRGTVLQMGNAQYSGTLFYGYQWWDGTLDTLSENEIVLEGSLTSTGLHRTAKEAAKKHNAISHIFGANFKWQTSTFRLGLQGVGSLFSLPVPNPGELYRQYSFTGQNQFNVSVDYQWLIKKHILFGELAIGKQGYPAFLQGVILNLDPSVKIGALFRYYHQKYIALNGNAFQAGSSTNGETGLYLTADVILGRRVVCSLFNDIYYFSWLKYRLDKPSNGYRAGLHFDINITRNSSLLLRYSYKNKEQNGGENPYWHEIVSLKQHLWKAKVSIEPHQAIKLATELDVTAFQNSGINKYYWGYLIFQDLSYSIPKIYCQINARIAYFDTDSYDERIYAYEHDLYQALTIQSYYYQGWRGYLMLNFGYKFFNIAIRLSQTYYLNKAQISSGLDLISSPHKTDLRVQAIFKF